MRGDLGCKLGGEPLQATPRSNFCSQTDGRECPTLPGTWGKRLVANSTGDEVDPEVEARGNPAHGGDDRSKIGRPGTGGNFVACFIEEVALGVEAREGLDLPFPGGEKCARSELTPGVLGRSIARRCHRGQDGRDAEPDRDESSKPPAASIQKGPLFVSVRPAR